MIGINHQEQFLTLFALFAHCYPRARTFHGEHEVFINQSEFLERAPKYIGLPGVVLNKNENELIVKTKDSFIKILDWESNSPLRM